MNLSQRQLLRRLIPRLLVHWPALSGMVFCMVAIGLLTPALPWMLSPLLDHGNADKDYFLPADWLPLAFFLLIVLQSSFSYGRAYLSGWLDTTLQRDFRMAMAAHLLRLPMARLQEETKGKITSRFMSFLALLTSSLTQVFLALIQETVKIISLTFTLFYLQWQLAIIVFFVAPIVALTIRHLKRRMKSAAENSQNAIAQGQNRLNETIQLLPIIKMQGGTHALDWLNKSFSRLRGTALRVNVIVFAGQPITHIMLGIPFAIIVMYMVDALTSGEMSAGTAASFMTAMILLPQPVRNLTRAVGAWEQMFVAANEIFSFLDIPPETDNGKKQIQRAHGELSFEKVSFAYTAGGASVLDDVSFSVAAGETVALVGHSGAGKTTITSILARFYTPQTGVVRLDGDDINEITLPSLRQQFSLVTQHPLLFDDTVAMNVAYPDDGGEDVPRLEAALKNAAAGFVFDLPNGIHQRIGEDGKALSVGQRQRLALARAFYRDAPIIILDEPTASLDGETEAAIKDAMRRLLVDRTAVIVAHHFTTIDFVDRVMVLSGGKIIASGGLQHLRETCPLFAELYNLQILKK